MSANHPLRLWRRKYGKTAADFGRAIGVTKTSVVRYESWRRTPALRTIARIMIATDGAITAKDFMRREAAE